MTHYIHIHTLDPSPMDTACRRDFSPTCSISSDISVQTSHRLSNSPLVKSAGWTNESHDAYLNFLEASFVQQLNQFHSSIGLRSRCRDLSDQDGSRMKIKCEDNEPCSNDSADSHCYVGRQETSASFGAVNDNGFHLGECRTSTYEPAACSSQHHDRSLCHLSSDEHAMEVSDQNFAEEDRVEDSSYHSTAKRLKTSGVDHLRSNKVFLMEKHHSPNPDVKSGICTFTEP